MGGEGQIVGLSESSRARIPSKSILFHFCTRAAPVRMGSGRIADLSREAIFAVNSGGERPSAGRIPGGLGIRRGRRGHPYLIFFAPAVGKKANCSLNIEMPGHFGLE